MSTGLDKMFEDMSHTSGTPFVSGTKSNSTPASKQFYILVRRVPNEDISNITTCTATNVFFLRFDSVLFIFKCWFFVCLFVCLFFFWGGGGGGRDKKGMRTYHELFHWHSNRHMKHLDLNSILPEREFLQWNKIITSGIIPFFLLKKWPRKLIWNTERHFQVEVSCLHLSLHP